MTMLVIMMNDVEGDGDDDEVFDDHGIYDDYDYDRKEMGQ